MAGHPVVDGAPDPAHAGRAARDGIARPTKQTSGGLLSINYGTLYPGLSSSSSRKGSSPRPGGVSENNRKAKFYKLTRAGAKQNRTRYRKQWETTAAIMARFLSPANNLTTHSGGTYE